MKRLILAIALILNGLVGCATMRDEANESKFDVRLKYGEFVSVECEYEELADGHMVPMQSCKAFDLVDEVSVVNLKLGVTFGIGYTIQNLKGFECYRLAHYLDHPPILQPDGRITSSYIRELTYNNCANSDGVIDNMFTWIVEEEWEGVPGAWTFKILIDEHPVVVKKMWLQNNKRTLRGLR